MDSLGAFSKRSLYLMSRPLPLQPTHNDLMYMNVSKVIGTETAKLGGLLDTSVHQAWPFIGPGGAHPHF